MDQERISRRKRARQIVAARLEKLDDLSVGRLVPSTLTLLGLCSGATAIRLALENDFRRAVIAVVAAGVFDMLDGRAARLLGADSRFGAQLDSLADLVSFGIAPAVIMYVWSLSGMGDAGWIATLIFCACSAIRLARFNVQAARDEGATNVHPYFTGLPTPAAACMMLLPLLISFQWNGAIVRQPVVVGVMIAVTSVMMVSKLPTPSIKYMRLQRQHRILAGLFFAALAGALIAWPWATLTIGLVIYIASIPLAIVLSHPRHATKPVAEV
ncbi:MAG TPA: CDP-diacylglycerol--serine O-phosphatidyltransferase [Rhizomicrobium sp.]|nr:CDP-diacylglycerol--serine O-phosphatidyltransferase [Rhizomicrobium sp.]